MNLISRAQFLCGDWRGRDPYLRPPWALNEPDFSDICDGCGDCATACETSIILISSRKLPELNFSNGGCTFCGRCIEACETGALQRDHTSMECPWLQRATINDICLAKRGIGCIRCIEECEYDAIISRPAVGGKAEMEIRSSICTGCGMCYATCPANAISFSTRYQVPVVHEGVRENRYG